MVMLSDFTIFKSEDINAYNDAFTDYLKFCFETCCPLEKYFIAPNRLSTPYLKNLRRKKERSYKRRDYDAVKNFSKLIQIEIDHLNKNMATQITSSGRAKDIWSGIRRITQRATTATDMDTDINELNCSFIHKPETVQQAFDQIADFSEDFTTISVDSVLKFINKFRATSSAGSDGLLPLVIKKCRFYLAPIITELLNMSFSNGILPTSWKTVKITPIPKNGPGLHPTKFRPIASSSILLKVAENIILEKIQPQLKLSADQLQFAYKANRSTVDAIATLHHTIAHSIDTGSRHYQCVFLDFSSAFNTIDREKILLKLRDLGALKWCLRWLCDYFRDRFQYSFLHGKKSVPVLNCWGVLQGAVLSPFLFSLYTDSLRLPTDYTLIKYADDFALGHYLNTSDDRRELQTQLQEIAGWSANNDLHLNASKCNSSTFTLRSNDSFSESSLQLGDVMLESTSTVKYLGVTFSSDLTWSTHIANLYKKCLRLSFYIRRLRSIGLPNATITNFVDMCVVPIILYASPIIFAGLLRKDFVILRRAIKIIANSSAINYTCLTSTIVRRHFSACSNLSERILNDNSHPLHIMLSRAQSQSRTRNVFNLIYSRTSMFRRSTLPSLARFLSNREEENRILSISFTS
jgi:hypothetical protein